MIKKIQDSDVYSNEVYWDWTTKIRWIFTNWKIVSNQEALDYIEKRAKAIWRKDQEKAKQYVTKKFTNLAY